MTRVVYMAIEHRRNPAQNGKEIVLAIREREGYHHDFGNMLMDEDVEKMDRAALILEVPSVSIHNGGP
jgi:hypothetical protein